MVGELRSHKVCSGVKKKKKTRNSCYDGVHILVNVLHDNMYAISIHPSIYLYLSIHLSIIDVVKLSDGNCTSQGSLEKQPTGYI